MFSYAANPCARRKRPACVTLLLGTRPRETSPADIPVTDQRIGQHKPHVLKIAETFRSPTCPLHARTMVLYPQRCSAESERDQNIKQSNNQKRYLLLCIMFRPTFCAAQQGMGRMNAGKCRGCCERKLQTSLAFSEVQSKPSEANITLW